MASNPTKQTYKAGSTKVDIKKLNDWRVNEEWLVEQRAYRQGNFDAWHSRVEKIDRLYRGEWATLFPDETAEILEPTVQNIVQVSMDDIAKLVAESMPSVRIWPADDSEAAKKDAFVAEAISETYWEGSNGQLLVPQLTMDLIGTGASFVTIDTYDQVYPKIRRIDPRMCFPDTFNGRIQDLFVNQTIKLRVAARVFPEFADRFNVPPDVADSVEVWEYYGPDECVKAFCMIKANKRLEGTTTIVKRWKPPCMPVAMSKLDTFDGEFRGMFDQIDGSLRTKNRIVQLLMDYTDQITYAPMVSKGLLNESEQPGPDAHYRLDPNVPDAQVGRLQPAGSSPQLFALLEYLEREQRGATAYPTSRQGQVSQSIASASFVNSTQGQLTSVVRNVQRILGSLREDLNDLAFKHDKEYLDFGKPLFRSIGKKKTYTPTKDIPERIFSKVVLSASSGLDRMNGDVRVMQLLGAGLISRETAREQVDFLPQDGEESDRIDREMAQAALSQKFLGEAPWQAVAEVWKLMESGISLGDAVTEMMQKQEAEQAAAAAAGPAPGVPGEAGPMQANADQAGMERGAIPGGDSPTGESVEPKFQPPPLTNIMVTPNRG